MLNRIQEKVEAHKKLLQKKASTVDTFLDEVRKVIEAADGVVQAEFLHTYGAAVIRQTERHVADSHDEVYHAGVQYTDED